MSVWNCFCITSLLFCLCVCLLYFVFAYVCLCIVIPLLHMSHNLLARAFFSSNATSLCMCVCLCLGVCMKCMCVSPFPMKAHCCFFFSLSIVLLYEVSHVLQCTLDLFAIIRILNERVRTIFTLTLPYRKVVCFSTPFTCVRAVGEWRSIEADKQKVNIQVNIPHSYAHSHSPSLRLRPLYLCCRRRHSYAISSLPPYANTNVYKPSWNPTHSTTLLQAHGRCAHLCRCVVRLRIVC
jgi:hypothetical protein